MKQNIFLRNHYTVTKFNCSKVGCNYLIKDRITVSRFQKNGSMTTHVMIERKGYQMDVTLDIVRVVWPVALIGGIAVFVILRMNHKYQTGTLGKKKVKSAQNLLDSLIPLGLMTGSAVGILLSLFTPITFLSATTLGLGIGMLFGYVAYEGYSKKEESHS